MDYVATLSQSIHCAISSILAQCQRHVTSDTLGEFVWPLTKPEVTAQVMCPVSDDHAAGAAKMATRKW